MEIKIEPILLEQKPVLARLMQLYLYDFSLFSDEDVSEYGYYGYSHIDDYWNEGDRFPYFIRVDGKLAGFVLVRSCCEHSELPNPHSIAEFFVMKKFRRRGVGEFVATHIFNRHRGDWEVSQWSKNIPAQRFWENVLRQYTNGTFDKFGYSEEGHVGFTFKNISE